MHGAVSRKPLKPAAHIYKLACLLIGFVSRLKIRAGLKRFIKRHTELCRYHLCYLVNLCIGHIKSSSDIPQDSPCLKGTEGNYLYHLVLTVLTYNVIYNLLPSFIAEIHVYIRHGNSFGIKESLKQQAVLYRVYIRYTQ